MHLQKLSLTNFRVFKQAEFEFRLGMNLIVGINGAGKSSVLDAIRIMFSRVIPQISHSKNQPLPFRNDDITFNEDTLFVSIRFLIGEIPIEGFAHVPREKYIATTSKGNVRNQAYSVDTRYEFSPDPREVNARIADKAGQPLVLYFSTNRSSTTRSSLARAKFEKANADALVSRELRLKDFAEWWLVQDSLVKEEKKLAFGRHLSVLSDTISRFLDSVVKLKAIREPQTTLVVEKNKKQLDVEQLSDGERGILALVFDLARRLTQANPRLADPLKDGKAIVLIDELDLHLHPRWQRDIVQKLTNTFPNCQFIATTHSPQIVGEVSPENIIILEEGKQPYRPDQSLGMDSNWILRFLMGTDERTPEAKQELEQIANLIEKGKYDQATKKIESARKKYGEDSELVRLQTRIDRIRLLGE